MLAVANSARDLFILLAFLHIAYQYRRRRSLSLPPGPSRWPVLGNALTIPSTYPHVFYKQLGDKLGSKIVYLEALGQSIIVLNDINMARDLFEKRFTQYSSRPVSRMMSDVIGFKYFIALMPYGDEWRAHRQILQQHLSERHILKLQEKALEFVRKCLLVNLSTSPEDLHQHVRNTIGGFSVSITYGLPVQRQHDPLVHFAEKVLKRAQGATTPGKYLVDNLAPLKYIPQWMPGAAFKREAEEIRAELYRLMEDPYQDTLQRMDQGIIPSSFVTDALQRYSLSRDFVHLSRYIKQIAVSILGAVSETTVAAVMTFVLAMLLYPEVQLKAQKEVDSIVGSERLPEFADLPHLTFVSAIVKEVLRWNPVTPIGVPHTTDQEDIYMGYYIPKGCGVVANTYAMLHDETIFPEPDEFKPERFVNKDGNIRKDLPDPEFVATFGFGRRICPGAHIARPILYITICSLLCLFDISPAGGEPIDSVKPEFSSASMISEPLPFPCKVTPRKGKHVKNLLRDFYGTDMI